MSKDRMMTRFAITLALLTLAPSSSALAQEDRAQQLHERGRVLFLSGKYREAAALFEQSYAAYKHPNTSYALGETYRRLGEYRRSHRYYAEYAATLSPDKREAFQEKLDSLRLQQRGQVDVYTIPSGATVTIDGKVRGTTPAKVSVAGGEHDLVVEREGKRTRRSLLIEFGETLTLRLRLPTALDDRVRDATLRPDLDLSGKPSKKPVWKRWWFWTGIAVVVAGTAAVSIAALASSDGTHMPQGPVFEFSDFK